MFLFDVLCNGSVAKSGWSSLLTSGAFMAKPTTPFQQRLHPATQSQCKKVSNHARSKPTSAQFEVPLTLILLLHAWLAGETTSSQEQLPTRCLEAMNHPCRQLLLVPTRPGAAVCSCKCDPRKPKSSASATLSRRRVGCCFLFWCTCQQNELGASM